ncbi:leucyl aminopeptidase ['Fragaria x ananassa' phyllody phytoplasma]|uniref:Probable cytosol aminopeptidase n=1 Tax='Fragaria x ananassa' phyllody phytoplasma TaxID=2358428 RepID=A0ABS5K2S4_9MOLU|nr:leucyl aminopeptidase ['Fragaria x ananassa' phyllody phytoplasma]MBS2126187.1 leucyl aminopeptidase ['Fragaria x ananassa' phyllody phytoplasma]
MKISFITKLEQPNGINAAILLQVQKENKLFGLEKVDPKNIIKKSYEVENFEGTWGSQIKLLSLEASPYSCVTVLGLGKKEEITNKNWLKIGGICYDAIKKNKKVVIFADALGASVTETQIMNLVLGILLKSYSFDRYHTYKKENTNTNSIANSNLEIKVVTQKVDACQKKMQEIKAIAEGVNLSKELINEPANILGTKEFVQKIKELETMGIEVEVLEAPQLKQLQMNALLAVAQGSDRPPYLVVMKWKGDQTSQESQPLSVVGKGVVFDSGGISIKPSFKMQEMKSDMGGAAVVVGLMHTLATRKAQVNVIGIVGLVENMVSSKAQRPGDIVTSMSGQTIEVVNTDAEGRMVLCDALWYCKTVIKPQLIIDLATLTGAIQVALGKEYAGLFANNDNLAKQLIQSGKNTSEKIWQLPLDKKYDQLIDSQFADMTNSVCGGAGSITAAQFLKRFVGDLIPWAHIDIAGVCLQPKNEFNNSWASGFGVRLLNDLIKTYYEKND